MSLTVRSRKRQELSASPVFYRLNSAFKAKFMQLEGKVLIKLGVKINVANIGGQTPQDIAKDDKYSGKHPVNPVL